MMKTTWSIAISLVVTGELIQRSPSGSGAFSVEEIVEVEDTIKFTHEIANLFRAFLDA